MNDLTFTTQSSFLHHGIEGQKWGVRNGPPYPLDSQNAKRIVKEKRQEYKAIKNDYFKSAPGKIRNITPIVASLFGISASEDISGLINSIAKYLSTPKEERNISYAEVAKAYDFVEAELKKEGKRVSL